MKNLFRPTILFCSAFAFCFGTTFHAAEAHTHKHHHKHHVTHASAAHHEPIVRTAQRHLINLGYMTGHADGVLGTKTKNALRNFQHDHGLPATGKLTTPTYNALVEADINGMPAMGMMSNVRDYKHPGQPLASATVPDFYATHPDYYGHYNQQYADPMMMSPTVAGSGTPESAARSQAIPSRYGKVDLSENTQGTLHTYTVTVNGQSMMQNDGQPAVIGVSRTYELPNEDAIIFSTYRTNDPVCAYKHYLLTLHNNGQNLQEIGNCTRGFQAEVTGDSLMVVFPEADNGRAVGNTWRYENGDLERL